MEWLLLDHPEVKQIPSPVRDSVAIRSNDGEWLECDTELKERLNSVIGELPTSQQVVLRERFWNERTYADIARKLNCTGQTVHARELRALRKLRHPERVKRIAGDT
jgi:RNA polymerase sigma factor (sigma-70 family)